MLRCPPRSAYSRELCNGEGIQAQLYTSYRDHANVSPSQEIHRLYEGVILWKYVEIQLLHGLHQFYSFFVHLYTRQLTLLSHALPPEVALQGLPTRQLYSGHQALATEIAP